MLQSGEIIIRFLLFHSISKHLNAFCVPGTGLGHQKLKSNCDTVLKWGVGSGERGDHSLEGFVFHVFYTESRRTTEGI